MAHIVEFSIKGLTGRKKEYSQALNRDVNVFFGLNGTGKTSLLKILHSAMEGDATLLTNVPFEEAHVVVYSIDHDKNFEFNIKKPKESSKTTKILRPKLLTTGSNAITEAAYSAFLDASNPFKWNINPPRLENRRLRHRYLPISRLYIGSYKVTPEVTSEFSEDQLDARFSELLQEIWIRYSYDINIAVREAQEQGLASILKQILAPSSKKRKNQKDIPAEIAKERVFRFLSRQQPRINLDNDDFVERYKSNLDLRNIVQDIDTVESRIEQAMYPIDKLTSLVQQLFGGGKTIQFSGREIKISSEDGIPISPQLLSSGEKHLLKVLIEVLGIGDSTVIIDEPELSMHIDWQKNLLQNMLLLNPGTQIIAATHSPEIMSKLDDSKIFRL